jgi:hypothetical protein
MNAHDQIPPLSRRSLLAVLASLGLGLPSAISLARAARAARKFDTHFELAIDLEIAVQDGFRVRRPYVAVWLEDSNGKAVRTLSLWMQSGRKGARYIPDLRRWFRDELARGQAGGGDLTQTASSATREAGRYSVVWDGKNDRGALVDQGEYTLFIEAARQHGTYQLITQKLKIGTRPFSDTLTGNIEIKGATVELRKRK